MFLSFEIIMEYVSKISTIGFLILSWKLKSSEIFPTIVLIDNVLCDTPIIYGLLP